LTPLDEFIHNRAGFAAGADFETFDREGVHSENIAEVAGDYSEAALRAGLQLGYLEVESPAARDLAELDRYLADGGGSSWAEADAKRTARDKQ
jgi:hypothetical protein